MSQQARTPLLIAAAMLSIYFGKAATKAEALTDYFYFIAGYAGSNSGVRLIAQFLLGSFLYALAAALYFELLFGRTARYPGSHQKAMLVIDLLARLVIVLTPSIVLSYLLSVAALSGGWNWIIWLGLGVLALSVLLQVAGAAARHPLLTLNANAFIGRILLRLISPAERVWPYILPGALLTIVLLYSWLWSDVVGATAFIGGLSVIFFFFLLLLTAQRIIAVNKSWTWTFAGWLMVIVLICNVVPFGTLPSEFRHQSAKSAKPDAKLDTIEEIIKLRGVPTLSESFKTWLENKKRYELTNHTLKKYPVFIVAAQGGGQYAAYHTALSLARLYDQCPRLKDHVFAISSVSGGSVGAAVLAEMLRSSGDAGEACAVKWEKEGELERAVRRFFSNDFVTPVVASGLLFDLPAMLIPQLRLATDRAVILEEAFERAWQRSQETKSAPGGLEQSFYGRWQPAGQAPALFFNTTSSNYGMPVLISELYMAEPKSPAWKTSLTWAALALFDRGGDEELSKVKDELSKVKDELSKVNGQVRQLLHEAIRETVRSSEYTRPHYFNILEYRPDLQLNLSTAATLSARFPYVTPPGVLYRDEKIKASDDTLKQTGGLQLIDGGFWDNSGIATAAEIIRQLGSSQDTKELVKNVEFHLISFGHATSALQKSGARDAQSELVTPIATFEAVRQARRLPARDAGFANFHVIELFDHAFQAPLTWTLSERVRSKIEARSGGGAEPSLCCALVTPHIMDALFEIVVDLGEVGTKQTLVNSDYFRFVVPNKRRFEEIIWLVSDERGSGVAAPR